VIEYLGGSESRPASSPEVEFVGGPRAGEGIVLALRPETLRSAGGTYRRSVACADDGAQCYVSSPTQIAALDVDELVRQAEFGLIVTRRAPIAPAELADAIGLTAESVVSVLDRLGDQGWIDRDDAGRLIGSAGLRTPIPKSRDV
jgi:hypothetical protein